MKKLIVLISAALITAALLSGCGTSKHIAVTRENKDSLAVIERDVAIAKRDAIITELQTRLKELEYLGVEMQPCPQINIDSLQKALIAANCSPEQIESIKDALQQAQTIIERQADGTLKITGQVKSLTSIKSKLEETVQTQNREITTLKTELEKARTHVKTETVERIKEVERGLPWWLYWLILIGMVLAVITGWWLKEKADQLATSIHKP